MTEEIKKFISSHEMLEKLDSHYEKEEEIKVEINQLMKELNEIRDEIKLMQTLILFQMKKEYLKKK